MIATIPATNPPLAGRSLQIAGQRETQRKEVLAGIDALQQLIEVCVEGNDAQPLILRRHLYTLSQGQLITDPAAIEGRLDYIIHENLKLVMQTAGLPGFPPELITNLFKAAHLENWFEAEANVKH